MTQENSLPRCCAPWQQMVINAAGYANPCAYWRGYGRKQVNPICGNVNDTPLLEIWNSEVYQNLRKNMAKGDLKAAGCAECWLIRRGIPFGLSGDPTATGEAPPHTEYAKNLQLVREEIRKGTTILQSKPMVVSLSPSYQCNLRCIHCWQTDCRDMKLSNGRVLDEVIELIPVLDRISAGGGEPFFLPFWRRFIASGDVSRNPYLSFSTSTNATLIGDRILEGLRRFKRVSISVSFDAANKELYEGIRVNAKYEQVVRNVERLQALTSEKPQAGVSVCASIMKANLRNLPELIRFVGLRRICFHLIPVIDGPLEEVLTCFNNPAEEMKGWKEALEESYAMFDTHFGDWMREAPRETARKQIGMVENSVPWHVLKREHFLVKGELPGQTVAEDAERGRTSLAAFTKCNGSEHKACEYYSRLDGNRFEVHLPAGKYGVHLVPCFFGRPSGSPIMHVEVPDTSLRSSSPAGRMLQIVRRPTEVLRISKEILPERMKKWLRSA